MRVLGWLGIAGGLLLALAGFALLTFMHFPSETSVWSASPGRWDDYLLALACLGFGALLARMGDRWADSPIRSRFRALGGVDYSERRQRLNGCLVFGIALGPLGLILFMMVGTIWNEKGDGWLGGLIVGVWALPIGLVMRSGWRRFSGQGWFSGRRRGHADT